MLQPYGRQGTQLASERKAQASQDEVQRVLGKRIGDQKAQREQILHCLAEVSGPILSPNGVHLADRSLTSDSRL